MQKGARIYLPLINTDRETASMLSMCIHQSLAARKIWHLNLASSGFLSLPNSATSSKIGMSCLRINRLLTHKINKPKQDKIK